MTDRYDPGLLNDFGGGNVDWWWDYIRAEVDRCNDFHADILEAAVAAARAEAYREGWRFAFRQCERTGSVPDPDYRPAEAAQ